MPPQPFLFQISRHLKSKSSNTTVLGKTLNLAIQIIECIDGAGGAGAFLHGTVRECEWMYALISGARALLIKGL